jgi:hypothetical protein
MTDRQTDGQTDRVWREVGGLSLKHCMLILSALSGMETETNLESKELFVLPYRGGRDLSVACSKGMKRLQLILKYGSKGIALVTDGYGVGSVRQVQTVQVDCSHPVSNFLKFQIPSDITL